MERVKVTVTVDDSHLGQIEEVTRKLADSGMTVEQTLPTIGIITGAVQAAQVRSLQHVSGVRAVEVDRHYQLPPPDSNIQ